MTKLQKARKLIMKQLDNIANDNYHSDTVEAVVELSDVLTKTYNTELRAKEIEIKAIDVEVNLKDLDVFNRDDKSTKDGAKEEHNSSE